MAADADAPDGELNETAPTATSPTTPDAADEGSSAAPEESERTTAAEPETAEGNAAEDYDAAVADDEAVDDSEDARPAKRPMSHVRLATMVGVAVVVALAATAGWLGFRAYQTHQAEAQRQLFLQVGRQCAINLTTIDWQHAEEDVQRLLDSATGKFYDQFSQRKQPFIDVVKKAQSKSVGTVTEAGVESQSGNEARVIVAVSIKTTNLGSTDQTPREWRMQISLEKSGDQIKASNVSFVQ